MHSVAQVIIRCCIVCTIRALLVVSKERVERFGSVSEVTDWLLKIAVNNIELDDVSGYLGRWNKGESVRWRHWLVIRSQQHVLPCVVNNHYAVYRWANNKQCCTIWALAPSHGLSSPNLQSCLHYVFNLDKKFSYHRGTARRAMLVNSCFWWALGVIKVSNSNSDLQGHW